MYLSSLSAEASNLFIIGLNYSQHQTATNFYSVYIAINDKILNQVNIVGGYNSLDKNNESISLCGNFKEHKLIDLLARK